MNEFTVGKFVVAFFVVRFSPPATAAVEEVVDGARPGGSVGTASRAAARSPPRPQNAA